MHWKTHNCNGKRTCSKRISTSFVFLVNMNHWRGNFCAHNIAGGIKIKRYSACIGVSPLPQFDLFALPMIELCEIFSLESPARQQVLFVRQPFNLIWAVFVRFYVPAIFYGSRSDSFKFFISLSAWRVAEVCSHSFQIKTVCFKRLIESLDSVFANAWQNPINWQAWHRNEVDIHFDENRT